MSTQSSVATQGIRRIGLPQFTWHTLLHTAAIVDIIIMAAMGVLLRDRLPLGLALAIALGLWLLHWRAKIVGQPTENSDSRYSLVNWRGGMFGRVVLGAVFLDTTVWTLGAALLNAGQGGELLRLAVPASLAATSGAGIIAVIANLFRSNKPEAGGKWAAIVGVGAVAFFIVVMAAGLFLGRGEAQAARAPDATLAIDNLAFSSRELTAKSGQVTILVDNHDVWWHTFTIDGLKVDLKLPSSGKREVTFNAAPGTYTYYCAIPGHAALGMRGTLTVQ